MTTAFVLGNGISRKGLDIASLSSHGKIYGCNALYRDFVPDVLVATDRPIAEYIQNSGYSQQHRFYTRRPLSNSGALTVPKKYFGFSSGPIATALAALDQNFTVYLIGFDLGANENNKFNNVYEGTDFYKPVGSNPTYTGNWIKQLVQIFKDFPQTQFIRTQGHTTAGIPEFNKCANFKNMTLGALVDRINNQKDL